MNGTSIAIWTLLLVGMAAFLLSAVGMLVRDVYGRIQYTYPAATIGVVAIVAAILVHKPASQLAIKSILAGLVIVWSNPALSHATARAARVRRFGHWWPGEQENIRLVDAQKENKSKR